MTALTGADVDKLRQTEWRLGCWTWSQPQQQPQPPHDWWWCWGWLRLGSWSAAGPHPNNSFWAPLQQRLGQEAAWLPAEVTAEDGAWSRPWHDRNTIKLVECGCRSRYLYLLLLQCWHILTLDGRPKNKGLRAYFKKIEIFWKNLRYFGKICKKIWSPWQGPTLTF